MCEHHHLAEEARRLLATSDLLLEAPGVEAALDRLAEAITSRLAESFPLVLTVMGGAVIFAGKLLPRLHFPMQCDYLHVSRYQEQTQGGKVRWLVAPRVPVAGRTVLVLDDVLDEGITLAHIQRKMLDEGAAACLLAVLCEKDLGREKPVKADFCGVRLPNRYLFGCGMDVRGLWRNLPEIRALPCV